MVSLFSSLLAALYFGTFASFVDSFSVSNLRRSEHRSTKQEPFNRECQISGLEYPFSTTGTSSRNVGKFHHVAGITCREVDVIVEKIGNVTVLEATAESQDRLLNAACFSIEHSETFDTGSKNITLVGEDLYGTVLWPSSSAVANYLITHVSNSNNAPKDPPLAHLSILELGAGSGLVSIAASLGGASKVTATDYEQLPLLLLDYAKNNLNQLKKTQPLNIKTAIFDICNHHHPLPKADITIAADVLYDPVTSIAMAYRTKEALQSGSRVIIGCSPGRKGRAFFEKELQKLLPNLNVTFFEAKGRNDIKCSNTSPSIVLIDLLSSDTL